MTRHVAVFGEIASRHAHIIAERLGELDADWQVDVWPCDDDLQARDALIAKCEAAVMSADFILAQGNFGALMRGPKLKILLQLWVGTDWLDPGFLPHGLMICNAGGHDAPIAEYVLGVMLEHSLELRAMHTNMLEGKWHRSGRNAAAGVRHDDLAGKHVGIIGYGEIAKAVAARAHAFGMRVSAFARTPRAQTPAPLAWIGTRKDMPRLLAESDYIIVTCDLNDETEGMIDAAAFALMKPNAYIVNVARGEIIDEDALFDALSNKRIAGAALDTWYRYPVNIANAEPDPDRGGPYQGSKHDFIALDNVLLTPHMAAHTHRADHGRYESIAQSLVSYTNGDDIARYVTTGTGENLEGFKIP